MHSSVRPFALSALLLGSLAAAQQTAQALKVSLGLDLVTARTVDGKTTETLTPSPRSVLPGQLLRQEAVVANVSGRAVRNSVITVPVPRSTAFVGSATPSSVRWNTVYSIDGGKTYAATPKKTVTVTENGKSVTKEIAAPPAEYTNVRWQVGELAAEETLRFGFRVRVQ